jgi:hypothetical protein
MGMMGVSSPFGLRYSRKCELCSFSLGELESDQRVCCSTRELVREMAVLTDVLNSLIRLDMRQENGLLGRCQNTVGVNVSSCAQSALSSRLQLFLPGDGSLSGGGYGSSIAKFSESSNHECHFYKSAVICT